MIEARVEIEKGDRKSRSQGARQCGTASFRKPARKSFPRSRNRTFIPRAMDSVRRWCSILAYFSE